MAIILDVRSIVRDRFDRFAKEYLEIPDTFYCCGNLRFDVIHIIIGYLVEKGVFTMDEIRHEMKLRKIYLGEDIYQKALKEIGRYRA